MTEDLLFLCIRLTISYAIKVMIRSESRNEMSFEKEVDIYLEQPEGSNTCIPGYIIWFLVLRVRDTVELRP